MFSDQQSSIDLRSVRRNCCPKGYRSVDGKTWETKKENAPCYAFAKPRLSIAVLSELRGCVFWNAGHARGIMQLWAAIMVVGGTP